MSKPHEMIPGLNSNVKHEGRLLHIQTEDSGRRYAHVISHLFDEGTILASVKTDYSHLLDRPEEELTREVLEIMRRSHRTMIARLSQGDFNREAGLSRVPAVTEEPPASEPAGARSPEPSTPPESPATLPKPSEVAGWFDAGLTEAPPSPPLIERLRALLEP